MGSGDTGAYRVACGDSIVGLSEGETWSDLWDVQKAGGQGWRRVLQLLWQELRVVWGGGSSWRNTLQAAQPVVARVLQEREEWGYGPA